MKGTVIQILLLGYCGIILVSRIEAANPNYSYQVKLSDPLMGNFQEKGEKRLGEKTEGFYSVVDPDGRLRTVTYVSDEHGFRPTVTYSTPNQKLQHQPLATPVTSVQKNQPSSLNFVPMPSTLPLSPISIQYGGAYATPVLSVVDQRLFYKSQPLVPLITKPVVPVKALQPVIQRITTTSSIEPTNGYTYPVPEKKLEYPPPKEPTTPTLVTTTTTAATSTAYSYPAPTTTTTDPPTEYSYPVPTTSTPVPSTEYSYPVPTTAKPTSSGGYSYPVPQKKLEYPEESKIEEPRTTTTTELPLSSTETIVQAIPPKEADTVPETVPVPALQTFEPIKNTNPIKINPPASNFQYLHFGAKLAPHQPIPLHTIAPASTQFVLKQPIPQQVIYKAPPSQVYYTKNPAQAYYYQVSYPKVQQRIQPQIVQANVAPLQPHVVHNYEDIVTPNFGEMRYAAAPVTSYLPQTHQFQSVKPQTPAIKFTSKATKKNPLTFKYGYDNGVSKVSHSYFGSGW